MNIYVRVAAIAAALASSASAVPAFADTTPTLQTGRFEWRTQPLWGIGLTERVNGHTFFLHDGRARNLTEAILWHGGEAQAARDTFAGLAADDRKALIAFLESL